MGASGAARSVAIGAQRESPIRYSLGEEPGLIPHGSDAVLLSAAHWRKVPGLRALSTTQQRGSVKAGFAVVATSIPRGGKTPVELPELGSGRSRRARQVKMEPWTRRRRAIVLEPAEAIAGDAVGQRQVEREQVNRCRNKQRGGTRNAEAKVCSAVSPNEADFRFFVT